MVQWLRLSASTAGGMGSIPGWRTKFPHATRHGQIIKIIIIIIIIKLFQKNKITDIEV